MQRWCDSQLGGLGMCDGGAPVRSPVRAPVKTPVRSEFKSGRSQSDKEVAPVMLPVMTSTATLERHLPGSSVAGAVLWEMSTSQLMFDWILN